MTITVEITVNAPLERVWACWTEPEHVTKWAFASEDWEAPRATNDLRVGGHFSTIMAAKDKSASFDFNGTYTEVRDHERIAYDMEDGRHVSIDFQAAPGGVHITEVFDAEMENSPEKQRAGWQAILTTFKHYAESTE